MGLIIIRNPFLNGSPHSKVDRHSILFPVLSAVGRGILAPGQRRDHDGLAGSAAMAEALIVNLTRREWFGRCWGSGGVGGGRGRRCGQSVICNIG